MKAPLLPGPAWLALPAGRPLRAAVAFSCLTNALALVPSLFMLQVYDRVLASRSQETLAMLVVGMVVALALTLAFDHLRSRLQGVVGALVGDALLPRVVVQVLSACARGDAGGRRSSALRDVAAVRAMFSSQGLLALFDVPWLVVFTLLIAVVHPLLGLVAAASALAMLALAVWNDLRTRRDIEALQQEAGSTQRWLERALDNAEAAQAMGMGGAIVAHWCRLHARTLSLQRPMAAQSVGVAAATRTLRQLVQSAMLALGAYLAITDRVSPGVMFATTLLLGRALAPIEQVVGSWRVLAEGRAAWSRLHELLATGNTQVPARMALPRPKGDLTADGVALRAPGGDRWLLQGVTLRLEPGRSLGVVGRSGAGKSTLARVLVGLLPPTAGTVRLDDADLSQWRREEVGAWIGYVPQAVELFAGTVAENIARMQVPDPVRVVEAAVQAGVHAMILSLPQGYDTPIDPQGATVSPGQRQRIALARALYGAPTLLVLDEPNANLDHDGEVALARALHDLRGKVTVVVITHRPLLVQHVDAMLVLDHGRPTMYGATADVLARLRADESKAAPCTGTSPVAAAQVVALRAGGAGTT